MCHPFARLRYCIYYFLWQYDSWTFLLCRFCVISKIFLNICSFYICVWVCVYIYIHTHTHRHNVYRSAYRMIPYWLSLFFFSHINRPLRLILSLSLCLTSLFINCVVNATLHVYEHIKNLMQRIWRRPTKKINVFLLNRVKCRVQKLVFQTSRKRQKTFSFLHLNLLLTLSTRFVKYVICYLKDINQNYSFSLSHIFKLIIAFQ